MFHKALDLYEAEKLAYVRVALAADRARGRRASAARRRRGADQQLRPARVPGRDQFGRLRERRPNRSSADVIARRASALAALAERFERAKRDGDLPDHVEIAGPTAYLFAIVQGMAVQAGSGATRADLERVIETSLMMWPGR